MTKIYDQQDSAKALEAMDNFEPEYDWQNGLRRAQAEYDWENGLEACNRRATDRAALSAMVEALDACNGYDWDRNMRDAGYRVLSVL